MSSLADAYDHDSRWRSITRSVLLLVGSIVAAVGFAVTATSLIVGLGVGQAVALKAALLLGGAVPLAVFLVPRSVRSGGSRSLALAGAGTVAGLAGLALFWVSLPAGWSGGLARLPPVALGTYAAGLLAAFGASLAADADDGRQRSTQSNSAVRGGDGLDSIATTTRRDERADRPTTPSTPDSPGAGSAAALAVGDGGEDDDDVEFFDDE